MQSSGLNLTQRDIEMLRAIATHGCYKEACKELSISTQSLNNGLRRIKAKVGVESIPQLIHIMTKRGII